MGMIMCSPYKIYDNLLLVNSSKLGRVTPHLLLIDGKKTINVIVVNALWLNAQLRIFMIYFMPTKESTYRCSRLKYTPLCRLPFEVHITTNNAST